MKIPPNFMAGNEDRYMHKPEKEKTMADTQKKISRYELERVIKNVKIGQYYLSQDEAETIIESIKYLLEDAGLKLC